MTARTSLSRLYRSEESYSLYLARHPSAIGRMRRLIRQERSSFGRSLLDLGCGGGALARAYAGPGRRYVGVDANPDMIREARRDARSLYPEARFYLGDIRRLSVKGRFDTVTLVGNALVHLSANDFQRVLSRLPRRVRPGGRLLVDYRDIVQQFYDGGGHGSYTQHREGHRWVSSATGIDTTTGELLVSMKGDRARSGTHHSQGIWSPYILEAIMTSNGWTLLRRRREPRWHGWRDVYRWGRPPKVPRRMRGR